MLATLVSSLSVKCSISVVLYCCTLVESCYGSAQAIATELGILDLVWINSSAHFLRYCSVLRAYRKETNAR